MPWRLTRMTCPTPVIENAFDTTRAFVDRWNNNGDSHWVGHPRLSFPSFSFQNAAWCHALIIIKLVVSVEFYLHGLHILVSGFGASAITNFYHRECQYMKDKVDNLLWADMESWNMPGDCIDLDSVEIDGSIWNTCTCASSFSNRIDESQHEATTDDLFSTYNTNHNLQVINTRIQRGWPMTPIESKKTILKDIQLAESILVLSLADCYSSSKLLPKNGIDSFACYSRTMTRITI